MGTTLRLACADDAAWTHALRNLPHIRDASLDRSEIPFDEHVAWWGRALDDPDRHLLVIVHEGGDAGVLRLDRTGDAAEVSIYTRPELGGRGIGRCALLAAAKVARDELGVSRLLATIREENTGSQRAFAAAGFTRAGTGWTRRV